MNRMKTNRSPFSGKISENKPGRGFLNETQTALSVSGAFLMLSACSGMGGGADSEACRYYSQALQGGSGEFIGTQNKIIQSLQKQISEQCVPQGQIRLNIKQCRTRLLEKFGGEHNCG